MTIVLRRAERSDSASNWAAINPTLATGEWGYEVGTGRYKIGDGTSAWNALPYADKYPGGTIVRGASGDRFMAYQNPSGNLTTTAGREYAIPFILPTSRSVSAVSVWVSTAAAGSSVRFGWRADAQGWPGTLQAELGTAATTSTGQQTLAVALAPTPETLWWLSIAVQGGAPVLVQSSTTPTAMVTIPRASDWGTAARFVPIQDGVTGALPASFSARSTPTTMTGTHPAAALTLA